LKRTFSRLGVLFLWALGLCLAVAWGRSHLAGDLWRWVDRIDENGMIAHKRSELYIGGGGIGYFRAYFRTSDPERVAWWRWRAQDAAILAPPGHTRVEDPHYPPRVGGNEQWLSPLGIHCAYDYATRRGVERTSYAVTMPFWLLLLATWGYPLGRYVSRVFAQQRAERLALGMCPRCDCSVHGRPRCPSCGKTMPAAEPVEALAA
jgi:hypothetical protein